jgi:hypothetical protein
MNFTEAKEARVRRASFGLRNGNLIPCIFEAIRAKCSGVGGLSYPLAAGRALNFLVALIAIVRPGVVHAQQDGPRGYLLSPEGVRGAILTNAYLSSNQTPDTGLVVINSHISSFVTAPQYAQPFSIAGNYTSVFVVQPDDLRAHTLAHFLHN